MVNDGEAVSTTVRREFQKEADNIEDLSERLKFQANAATLFENGKQIYRGYIDDPRNTDNAWTETTAFLFHCSDQFGAQLQLRSGDDDGAVKWLNVDSEGMQQDEYLTLYGAHRSLIERAVRQLQGEVAPDSTCDNIPSNPLVSRSPGKLTRACPLILATAGPSTAGCALFHCPRSSRQRCMSRLVPTRFRMCCLFHTQSSVGGSKWRSSPV